jgi:hypothetical protein
MTEQERPFTLTVSPIKLLTREQNTVLTFPSPRTMQKLQEQLGFGIWCEAYLSSTPHCASSSENAKHLISLLCTYSNSLISGTWRYNLKLSILKSCPQNRDSLFLERHALPLLLEVTRPQNHLLSMFYFGRKKENYLFSSCC